MRNPLAYGALALFTIVFATLAPAIPNDDAPAAGTPGVEDGSCWKNNSGNEISVNVRGTVHGDQEITVSEGAHSGTGTGTPDPDGGCDESSAISVDSERYRVDDGGMQWKNPTGSWIDMSKTKCEDGDGDPPSDPGDENLANSVGSLPSTEAGGDADAE